MQTVLKLRNGIILTILTFLIPWAGIAQLRMITDNTGTQGQGKGQMEIINGLGFHAEHRCVKRRSEVIPVFSCGISEKTDVVIAYPFVYTSSAENSSMLVATGFSDHILELKFAFFEKQLFSLAIKPGVSVPTANYEQGLGSGRMSASLIFIMSTTFPRLCVNGNVGNLRNENNCGDALDIRHVSVDADYLLNPRYHLVLNAGIEKGPRPSSTSHPAFALLGFYYIITEQCEFSRAYKHGLTPTATNHAFIYGLTLGFG